MDDRPLAPILTELGMRLLTRLLVPVRRAVLGVDAWSDFFEFGHEGHPWWHYREDETGRLVLIRPATESTHVSAAMSAPAAQDRPAARPRRAPEAAGVSILLPGGRWTTSIPDYEPAVHARLAVVLDLLLYLLDHYERISVPRRTPGPPIVRAVRSASLLARDWGHQSGVGERGADRAIALLGERGILERQAVGSRVEYHLPMNALQRFEETFGFTLR